MKTKTLTALRRLCMSLGLFLLTAANVHSQDDDLLIADFEGTNYAAGWTTTGNAFGTGPARGTLPRQMQVTGYLGESLVNSFLKQDGGTGTLTSPPLKIERPYINFLVGGGGFAGETCIDLLIDGQVVRTATGPNTDPGGSETLFPASWDVSQWAGKQAVIRIVDSRTGGWGHINVDHIVQSATKSAEAVQTPKLVALEKTLRVDDTHLIVPVANDGKMIRLGIFDGQTLVQNFNVVLPTTKDASWLAAYPLNVFELEGKNVRLQSDGRNAPIEVQQAFDRIRIGAAQEAWRDDDYHQPYRNQFHASTRRGWNNDPNGLVYHDGRFHLYYQHNPFGISWGNMHWGHLQSPDLIHWEEKPITLFQNTVADMMFSGGGFVDFNNSSGLGKNTQFIAFTSTGRGECLAYSTDGGLTFTEIEENPVIQHQGRDPKIIWYAPQQKWVMAVFNNEDCAETLATPPAADSPENRARCNIAFWESRDLRQWTRTGAFTDPDRTAVYECPELFELPIVGKPGQSRWILLAAQNRYFIGHFDGQSFRKESGPHGSPHGAFYAAQTFSDFPDDRRVQIGWVRTDKYLQQFPDQIVNQAFTLPHELTLRETNDGLRVCFVPMKETEKLRVEVLAEGQDLNIEEANAFLRRAEGELSEVLIQFAGDGPKSLTVNGLDASFDGRTATIFTDRTFNEVYANHGIYYEVRKRDPRRFGSTETGIAISPGLSIQSLKIFRLKSIWSD